MQSQKKTKTEGKTVTTENRAESQIEELRTKKKNEIEEEM